jgi:hypothetical protein
MSEKKEIKPAPKDVAKAPKESKNEVVKAQESRQEKSEWTLEKCMKYARRYPTEIVWASASPSSYKSAKAHGWLNQCLAEMTKPKNGQVINHSFKKGSESGHSGNKKAA